MTCGGVAKPYDQFGPRPTHRQASAHGAVHATPVGAWPRQVTFGGVSKPHSWFEPRPLCRFFPVHSAAHAEAAGAWLGDPTYWVVSTSPTKWARPWARQQAGTCHQLSAAPPRPRVGGRGPVAGNGRGATTLTCVGGDTPTYFKMAAIGSGKAGTLKSMEMCLQTSRPSILALAGAAWAKLGQVSGVGVIYHPHEWEMHRARSRIVQRSDFADA